MTDQTTDGGGSDNRLTNGDADHEEGDNGGMGKGGATHDDFGKDSGIRPNPDEARQEPASK